MSVLLARLGSTLEHFCNIGCSTNDLVGGGTGCKQLKLMLLKGSDVVALTETKPIEYKIR